MVIVFPHCLKEMGTVRLRSIFSNHLASKDNNGSNEEFVHLNSLAPMIKDSLIRLGNSPIMEGAQLENFYPSGCHDQQKSPTVMTSTQDVGLNLLPQFSTSNVFMLTKINSI